LDYYSNQIILEYNFKKKWKKDTTGLKDFFFTKADIKQFSKTEIRALRAIYGRIVGETDNNLEGLLSTTYGKKTNIISMVITTTNEDLSIGLVERLYEELSKFYIEKTIERQEQTYAIMKAKVDSLRSLMNAKQYQLLRFQDSNKNLMLTTAEAPKYQSQRDLNAMTIAYGEALKNLEIADFVLKNSTPYFQIIDFPLSAIKAQKKSKTKAFLIGSLLGVLAGIITVLGRKIYREEMADA
jgi:hypothetical protein